MKQETVTLYELDELPKKIQEKVIEREQILEYENLELDFWEEDAITIISELGFENPKLSYDLSYCQGSHVDFEFSGINLAKLLSGLDFCKFGILQGRTTFSRKKTNSWYRTGHIGYEIDDCMTDEGVDISIPLAMLSDTLLEIIKNTYRTICSKLMREGYDYIEHATSEETIRENLKANNIHFTANGKRW